MSENRVQRPRHLREIQRVDEQARVADLPAGAAAHEAPKLLVRGPTSPGRLLLKGAERTEVSLSFDDLFDGGGAERADQLVLEVCDADVEAESFHLGAGEVGTETGTLESTLEVALLSGVAEARQSNAQSLRTEQGQEPADRLRTPDRQHGDALGAELPAAPLG
jgi:hypothetical protein